MSPAAEAASGHVARLSMANPLVTTCDVASDFTSTLWGAFLAAGGDALTPGQAIEVVSAAEDVWSLDRAEGVAYLAMEY